MKNQLTLSAFADWCEKQPPEREYNYMNNRNCAGCQYLKAIGLPVLAYGVDDWRDRQCNYHDIPDGWNDCARARPWAFGALASRLREAAGAKK